MSAISRWLRTKKSPKVTSSDPDVLDCVVIGAGWSGLAAARHLQAKGRDNFIVLEGREDIGGRCRTVTLQDGVSVADLGAEWIHGAHKSNPVYQAAKKSGIELVESKYESQALYQLKDSGNVHPVSDQEFEKIRKKLMAKGFFPYQEKRQDDDPDVSLRECAEEYLQKIKASPEERTWMEYILDAEIAQEYGASLEDMSMHWWDSDEDMPGGDVHVAKDTRGGYMSILQHYSKSVHDKVQLNSKVKRIDWSQNHQITIQYTVNGLMKEVRSHRVLITVPLGVLKANLIQFVPELPRQKQQAISRIGFGLLNKCIFLWDEQDAEKLPWPQDKEWLEKVVPPGETQGRWTEFFNARPGTGRPVLCAFSAGRIAEQIESYSDDEIQSQALKSLEQLFAPRSIPKPKQVIVTKWGQDDFTRGSYSYNAFGGKHKDRKRLAAPINHRLYFAGEACHLDYFGTTQGALMSGISAAKGILRDSSEGFGSAMMIPFKQKSFRKAEKELPELQEKPLPQPTIVAVAAS